ncbi:hypothetical protein JOF28_001464 [Leucobacter exalbidus]|uniref:O-antigen ligase n=1 Tax=Leucobacter exalbidus TaxID=662960 RepID=A0A940PSY9_9MICO|nr:hypothetical protein [Leucobacter exalbidus]MBP1326232.1 hypothetical protein [Leucobacter exalbidus]
MTHQATPAYQVRTSFIGDQLFPAKHSARIIDAVLMGFIIMRIDAPFLPVSVPLAQVAMIVLLFTASFRRPTRSLERVRWFPIVALLLLAYLMTVSLVQDVDFVRRLGNIALLLTVSGFLASGRIDVVSALKGLGGALVINAALFYAGIAPNTYGGVLTGYLADKNAAGLVYGISALLCSLTTRRAWLRLIILAAGAGALVLTDSRTSMAAYGLAAIWLFLAPRLGLAFQALLGAALAASFAWLDQNLAESGSYAVTRAGSDALRDRIDAATDIKVAETPWYGGGLGEANTEVEGLFWFFHNSYDALIAEGGYPALIGVVALYVLVGFGLLNQRRRSYASAVTGAATLFALLAATRLGEVFFAPIGFVLLGVGLALIVEHDPFKHDRRIHGDFELARQRGSAPQVSQ